VRRMFPPQHHKTKRAPLFGKRGAFLQSKRKIALQGRRKKTLQPGRNKRQSLQSRRRRTPQFQKNMKRSPPLRRNRRPPLHSRKRRTPQFRRNMRKRTPPLRRNRKPPPHSKRRRSPLLRRNRKPLLGRRKKIHLSQGMSRQNMRRNKTHRSNKTHRNRIPQHCCTSKMFQYWGQLCGRQLAPLLSPLPRISCGCHHQRNSRCSSRCVRGSRLPRASILWALQWGWLCMQLWGCQWG